MIYSEPMHARVDLHMHLDGAIECAGCLVIRNRRSHVENTQDQIQPNRLASLPTGRIPQYKNWGIDTCVTKNAPLRKAGHATLASPIVKCCVGHLNCPVTVRVGFEYDHHLGATGFRNQLTDIVSDAT